MKMRELILKHEPALVLS